MKIADILRGIDAEIPCAEDMDIKKITTKADEVDEETLFIFFKSIKSDNGKKIDNINKAMPRAILTDVDIKTEAKIPKIKVSDARAAYALAMFNFCKIDVEKTDFYAVTGTNGKTTTATMLYNIFMKNGEKCGFIGTGKILINGKDVYEKNYSMTTPDPDLLYPIIKRMQREKCTKIIMEVSSHSIALKKVYPLKFKFGIFTNLSEEHLDFHKGIDDYYQTKLSLFHSCENGIFNLDNPYCMQAMMTLQNEINVHGIGIIKDADAMARDIIIDGFWGSKFIYREKKKIFKINLNLSGTYNIYNAMLAIKCALLSGVSPSTVKTSLKELASVDGRFEKVSQSPMVIIDYAHTEKALENLLIFVNSTKNAEQNICTVFGCGGERDRQKRPKMARIAQKYSDFVIVTTDNSRGEDASEIIREIELGFENSENHITIENRRRAIEFAVKNASEYDIVLIVGKGHERYNIDELGYHFFDERKIVKDALKEKERNQNNENRA